GGADGGRPAAGETRAAEPQGESVAACVLCRVGIDAVRLARMAPLRTEPRPLLPVPADADVDVVALREDPAVAAADDSDLEHHRAGVSRIVRVVGLERDAVDDALGQSELLRGGPVTAVGAD